MYRLYAALIIILFLACTRYTTRVFFSDNSKDRFIHKLNESRIEYKITTLDTGLYEIKYDKKFDDR